MWKTIPTYPNYEISDLGEVRRIGSIKLLKQETLKGNHPYQFIGLSAAGKQKKFSVHRLVLQAFVGPCPDGCECMHLDDNPKNNKLKNLKWGTVKENRSTIKRKGEHGSNSKLTTEQVLIIRELVSYGNKQTLLAKDFNVTQAAISNMVTRRTWSHI
jgi:hypothetical protein